MIFRTGTFHYYDLFDFKVVVIFCICRFISVVNGKDYFQDNENEFWHETIWLSTLIPNSARKCVMLQWPSILNFTGKPFVSNYTFACIYLLKWNLIDRNFFARRYKLLLAINRHVNLLLVKTDFQLDLIWWNMKSKYSTGFENLESDIFLKHLF